MSFRVYLRVIGQHHKKAVSILQIRVLRWIVISLTIPSSASKVNGQKNLSTLDESRDLDD